jgi:gamma-tubulin complex component 2
MPQRKDTPAARAALARRRQRAAQTLSNPELPTTSTSTSTGVSDQAGIKTRISVTTTAAATATATNRPYKVKSQSTNKGFSPHDEIDGAARTVPVLARTDKFMDYRSKANSITTTITSTAYEQKEVSKAHVERRAISKQPSSMMDVSLTKSQSFGNRVSATTSAQLQHHQQHRPINYGVRTETETGFSSTHSAVGEYNIETVLHDGTSTGDQLHSSTSMNSHSQRIRHQQTQEEKEHQNVYEQQEQQQHHNHSPEKYERISNFGYVERTSPQPMVRDRRDLIRYESSSPSKEVIMSSPTGSLSIRNDGKPMSKMGDSGELELPELEVSAPRQLSNRKDIAKSTQKRNSKNDIATNTKSATNTAANVTIKKPKSQYNKLVDHKSSLRLPKKGDKREKTVQRSSPSNYKTFGATAGRRSPLRVSRIPSPTPINPDTRRMLPKRNASPKRTKSPEKRASPRRFRLPPNSPPKSQQPLPQPGSSSVPPRNISRFSSTNRDKSNQRLPKPTPASSETKRHVANTHPTSSTPSNSISQFHKLRPVTNAIQNNLSHGKLTSEKSNNNVFVESSPNHWPKVEDLSQYLMDSCSIADTSLIPDAEQHQGYKSQDPAMQSRNFDDGEDMKTNGIQSSSHVSSQYGRGHRTDEIDEKLDKRIHSQFVIRQDVSSQDDEIERYRASADENDAKHLNVPLRSTTHPAQKFGGKIWETPTKKTQELSGLEEINRKIPQCSRDCQVVDAACLHSGDFIMLRCCSMLTTLQKKNNEIHAKFSGPCLGKDEESLQVIKIDDGSSSPLMYGDVVLLQSSTTRTNNTLGARRKRNDVNGKEEVGFFHDGNKRSSRWMIHSAKSGTSIMVGRAAVTGGNPIHDSTAPIRSGNSILLVNCLNGGLLSIRDGVVVLLTDSYDPNRTPFSDNPSSLLGRLERHDRIEASVSETFQLLKLSIPPCPTWVTPRGMGERLFLTGSYSSEPLRNQKENIIVDTNLPLKAKENILIDEVIGSFLGLEGLYVKLKESEEHSTIHNIRAFQLFDGAGITFDLSLRNLVEQILPLSTSYVRVRNFIGLQYPGYEYGRVMQAFCEGLDLFLQQFVSFVAQLEHQIRKPPSTGVLTMKNIHFEITPLLHSMSILEHTTKILCNKKGGALINALRSLEKKVYMGDTVAKDLLGTLLDRASVPYAEMLSIWLQSGGLYDPYEEFMIKKTHDAKNGVELDGDTWAELFTINEEHVINDIVRNEKFKNKILVTGKYWNAVQACIVDIMSSKEIRSRPLELKKLQFQSDLSEISAYIDSMYESASEKLMHILRDKFHLNESLQIMKRYFLLDQGDFLVSFLEATGEELAKPFEEVSIGRVQHFLGISVQLTESQREDDMHSRTAFDVKNRYRLSPTSLRCRLSEHSLVSYLDSLYGGIEDRGPNTPSRQKYGSQKQGSAGFDFFEIDFSRVPFPISLIISPTSMENYKLLFRHLFFAKHVERRLVGVWSDHQVLKKLDSLRGLLGPTFLLRQRMLHCVQNLMYYMSFEVVESNWTEMLSSINVPEDVMSSQKQQTVDDLLNIHDGFLQKTIDSCLLTNPVLIKSLIKLLNTCLLFTDQMKRFMDTTMIVSINLRIDCVEACISKTLTSHKTLFFQKLLSTMINSILQLKSVVQCSET